MHPMWNHYDNHGHNILRNFDVWPNFPFTASEKSVIISNKHDIYELPHELPNDFLRLNTNLQKKCKYQENLKSS